MRITDLRSAGRKAYAAREYGAVYTGFEAANKNKDIVITGDAVNRKVKVEGTFIARYKMNVVTELVDGWESPAHDNETTKRYMLCYNGSFVWVDLTENPVDMSCLLIAYAFYDATAATWVYLRECHGFMSETIHYLWHKNNGTVRDDNGVDGIVSDYVLDSTTAADRRPDISAIDILDEDAGSTITALTGKKYTQVRLVGSGAVSTFNVDQDDIPKLSTSNPYYNQYTGGAWTDTLMPANSVASIWDFVLPVCVGSEKYKHIFVQPQWITQAVNSSTGSINAAVTTELSTPIQNLNYGDFLNLVPESVTINRIVIAYTGGNWVIKTVVQVTGSRVLQIQGQTGSFGNVFGAASSTDGKNVIFDGTSGKLIKEGTNTDTEIAAAVSALHARQHSMLSTIDHTSTATSGKILKADANGLPVDSIVSESGTEITISGSLGIGTTPSASAKLDIVSTGGTNVRIGGTALSDYGRILFHGNRVGSENTIGSVMAYNNQSGSAVLVSEIRQMHYGSSADNRSSMLLSTHDGTNLVTAMYVDATQKIGLGTTTPVEKLDVSGDIKASGDSHLSSTSWFYFGAEATDGTWRMGRDGNNFVHQRRESGTYVTKTTILP